MYPLSIAWCRMSPYVAPCLVNLLSEGLDQRVVVVDPTNKISVEEPNSSLRLYLSLGQSPRNSLPDTPKPVEGSTKTTHWSKPIVEQFTVPILKCRPTTLVMD